MKRKKVLVFFCAILLITTTNVYATDKNNMKDIVAVQEALNKAGYECGTPTGEMDDITVNAIKKYQEDHNLLVSGFIANDLLVSLGIAKEEEEKQYSLDEAVLNKEEAYSFFNIKDMNEGDGYEDYVGDRIYTKCIVNVDDVDNNALYLEYPETGWKCFVALHDNKYVNKAVKEKLRNSGGKYVIVYGILKEKMDIQVNGNTVQDCPSIDAEFFTILSDDSFGKENAENLLELNDGVEKKTIELNQALIDVLYPNIDMNNQEYKELAMNVSVASQCSLDDFQNSDVYEEWTSEEKNYDAFQFSKKGTLFGVEGKYILGFFENSPVATYIKFEFTQDADLKSLADTFSSLQGAQYSVKDGKIYSWDEIHSDLVNYASVSKVMGNKYCEYSIGFDYTKKDDDTKTTKDFDSKKMQ